MVFFDKVGSVTWRVRRRLVVLTLLYCAAMVAYIVVWGRPIPLSEAVASALILLAGSTLSSYLFGVVWDDKNKVGTVTTEVKTSIPVEPAAEPKPPEGFAS